MKHVGSILVIRTFILTRIVEYQYNVGLLTYVKITSL